MMIAIATESIEHDARGEPRTSLFVMATLYSDAGSSPVKVRDVSPGGALIEGAVPPPGTRVRLCRGSLNVIGEMIWCREGRAGLRFESSTSVAQWLPKGQAVPHQQRVDEIVQHVKASDPARPLSPAEVAIPKPGNLTALELTRLRVALESLAEDLAADPGVVERHLAKLQTLDLVAQALNKLAAGR